MKLDNNNWYIKGNGSIHYVHDKFLDKKVMCIKNHGEDTPFCESELIVPKYLRLRLIEVDVSCKKGTYSTGRISIHDEKGRTLLDFTIESFGGWCTLNKPQTFLEPGCKTFIRVYGPKKEGSIHYTGLRISPFNDKENRIPKT